MNRTTYQARALCAAAAMFVSLGGSAVFAQATGGQAGSSDNAPPANANSTTATGTTSRTDNPTGRDATRNRARTRNDSANPSGEYVPRTGSTSHQDKNGNVVKDRSTGGSPQGRERPPASPANIPATHP
ncbi:hypothetical protein R16034_03276 [Ralstonia edaphis]|uniref:Uncharacterized protein n=1 Tax=Ralstonia edaphi TaxID=3058599 RepID=A0AB72X5E0_9RALS|nr:hypothetical protein [Ralstonia sp. LMG 6871]CAJ0742707.1 hypothetical protein R16034_03276 [Ralstonia sp. LMG 6871]